MYIVYCVFGVRASWGKCYHTVPNRKMTTVLVGIPSPPQFSITQNRTISAQVRLFGLVYLRADTDKRARVTRKRICAAYSFEDTTAKTYPRQVFYPCYLYQTAEIRTLCQWRRVRISLFLLIFIDKDLSYYFLTRKDVSIIRTRIVATSAREILLFGLKVPLSSVPRTIPAR